MGGTVEPSGWGFHGQIDLGTIRSDLTKWRHIQPVFPSTYAQFKDIYDTVKCAVGHCCYYRPFNIPKCPCTLGSHVGRPPTPRNLESNSQVCRLRIAFLDMKIILLMCNVVVYVCHVGLQLATRRLVTRAPRRVVKVEANLFERVVRVAKSYANALVSSVEDPEKVLDQAVEDMQNDLIRLRQGAAEVTASEKRMQAKYEQAKKTAVRGYHICLY